MRMFRMKKILIAVVVFAGCCMTSVLLNSCADKRPAPDTSSADSLSVDTIVDDVMEEIISEMPMPKSAEELFDDFFFNFSSSRKLQKSRIDFPLKYDEHGKTSQIKREEWKHEYFYARQNIHTLIFDNYRQMAVQRDTSINKATVEIIDLNAMNVKRYHFSRKNGEWRMNNIVEEGLERNPNESFLRFYQQFVSDEEFQLQSIADPLEFSGPDPDDELSTMEGMLLPEQFPSFAPPLPTGVIFNVVYGKESYGSNQKILLMQGVANGDETELVFHKKSGRWQLVKLQI